MEVSENYWIRDKRILADGTEDFLESSGSISMAEKAGMLKIGGDLVMQSRTWSSYCGGTLEIGGDFIQKSGNNYYSNLEQTLSFVGEKVHRVEFKSGYGRFANLKSEGKIE